MRTKKIRSAELHPNTGASLKALYYIYDKTKTVQDHQNSDLTKEYHTLPDNTCEGERMKGKFYYRAAVMKFSFCFALYPAKVRIKK